MIQRASLLVLMLASLAAPKALAQTRSVDAIVRDIEAQTMPLYDRNRDTPNTHYRAEFMEQRLAVSKRRAALIGELYLSHPFDPHVADYIPERWETLFKVEERYDDLLSETAQLLDARPNFPSAQAAWYWRAMSAMQVYSRAESYDPDRFLRAIEEFIRRYPDDSKGSSMLYEAASFHVTDHSRALSILRRIVDDFPKSGAARDAAAKLRQVDGIGKPFELKFTDAISGRDVSIADLRGKIVVVDFWAAWCPPCIEEVPHLKELYKKWKPQGVEFIGVSLDGPADAGGLDQLKTVVAENKMPWPQYHQGQGWQSDFSSSWGIDRIPCIFVVDADGNLAATDVGEQLEATVQSLIDKRGETPQP